MFFVVTASQDSYITNKIIDNTWQETANVGYANTLDLFKLYGETLGENDNEFSKILIKFDFLKLYEELSSSLNTSDETFKAILKLKNVKSSLATPENFSVVLYPIAKDWIEGSGKDIISFSDSGPVNFLSASASTVWEVSGAMSGGQIGETVDYYNSYFSTARFESGIEDLEMDVTQIMSATLEGIIPDRGFLLQFSGTDFTDNRTRFVKRFGSRQSRNFNLRPRIEISQNIQKIDNRSIAQFDNTNIFNIQNTFNFSTKNFVSASTQITGTNCIIFSLLTGSFTYETTGSQYKIKNTYQTGEYVASCSISSDSQDIVSGTITISDHIRSTGSITFTEKWTSLDRTKIFATGTITLTADAQVAEGGSERTLISKTTCKQAMSIDSKYKIKVFFSDPTFEKGASRIPVNIKNEMPTAAYWALYEAYSDYQVIPFEKSGGTAMSHTQSGSFFDFYTFGLQKNVPMKFKYLIIDNGKEYIISEDAVIFTIQ